MSELRDLLGGDHGAADVVGGALSLSGMPDLPLTAFDVAALLVVGLSVLVAYLRGAIRELLTIATWLGAGVVAFYGFPYARELARRTMETEWLADAAALVRGVRRAPDRLQGCGRGAHRPPTRRPRRDRRSHRRRRVRPRARRAHRLCSPIWA